MSLPLTSHVSQDDDPHRGVAAELSLGTRRVRIGSTEGAPVIGRLHAANAPALIHVCGRYLPLSETFTYALIRGLAGFSAHVLAASIENLEQFPLDSVHVPEPEERAWAFARAVDARAIVCHFGPQATTGMSMALALDLPAVTIFHGYDISRLLRDRRWVDRYRAVARHGMHAICISNAGRERLIEIGWPDRQVEVVRLGVDTQAFAFRPPRTRWGTRQPTRLLMVARLVEKKGVHVALEAMRLLRDSGFPFALRIVGEGPERGRLQAFIAAERLQSVALLGALDHEQTRHEIAAADLYIQPSVTAACGDQEGIPVSLMEAQASGLPVVTTRHSGIPELVEDGVTGYLTDEGDAEGLAAAIARLAQHPDQAEAFAAAGRARVEQEFDMARQARRFRRAIGALVRDPLRRPGTALMRRPPARRRALIICAIPLGLMARKLLLLTHRHPDTRWDMLAPRTSEAEARRMPLLANVFAHPNGRLSLRRVGVALLQHLQEVEYDFVVVPYGDETGQAFAHVRRLATEVGAARTVALTMRDHETALPARRRRLHLARPTRLQRRGT